MFKITILVEDEAQSEQIKTVLEDAAEEEVLDFPFEVHVEAAGLLPDE